MPACKESPDVQHLRDAVDAVLVPRGFAAGQGGTDQSRGGLTWCAAADDFAARFPALPPSHEPPDGWGTRCTDVVVDVALDDWTWRISGIFLEGDDLDHLLTHFGSLQAQPATALAGLPVAHCLALLAGLLDDATGQH